MRKPLPFLALSLGLCLPACDGGPGRAAGPDLSTVSATRIGDGVRIVNQTDESFAYAVWNPDVLALFAPCVDTTPDCPRLGPHDTVDVADADVFGYAPGIDEIVVRWWRVLPDGAGGWTAGAVSEVVVRL